MRRLTLAAALLAACSGGARPNLPVEPPPDVAPQFDAAPAGPTPAGAVSPYSLAPDGTPAGMLLGQVTLAAVPPRAWVAPSAAPTGCRGAAAPPLEHAPSGGVVGAIVWLDDITRGKPPLTGAPAAELFFDGCVLRPRAVIVPALGGELAVENADPLRHQASLVFVGEPWRAQVVAPAPLAEWPMPLEGQRFTLAPTEPGLLLVSGDGAPAPRALAVVPRHPYYAATDADGRFRLDGIPPGSYHVRAWHPAPDEGAALAAEASVTIVADTVTEAVLPLARP